MVIEVDIKKLTLGAQGEGYNKIDLGWAAVLGLASVLYREVSEK